MDWRLPVLVCAGVVVAGCSPGSTPPPPRSTPAGSPHATATATATATASTGGLAACPSQPVLGSGLPVLHRGGAPDDLASDGVGGVWVSDTVAGTVYHVTAGGAVDLTLAGFSSPEGLVLLPGGDLLVAEQGRNRVLRVQPSAGGARSVYAALPAPPAGVEGVDGIGWDAAGARALIPDSAHGVLLVGSTRVASGLGRPVGAAVGPDGAVYVTAEDAAPRGLLRVAADGTVRTVGTLRQLDDIVVLNGLLYVTDLAAGSVHAVDPQTGSDRTVVSGIGQPQGLAALGDGRLAVADSADGVIRTFAACA